jgi:hypothetical protein
LAEAITGGCRCGAVRYHVALERRPAVYACHCLDCQTWTGSAFSQQFLLAEDALTVTGPVEIYELTSPEGRVSRQRVCGTCHTRLYNTNSARPGIAGVRAGTLDASDTVDVVAHMWTKRKQPWIVIAADTPQWPQSAPPAEFVAALSGGEATR